MYRTALLVAAAALACGGSRPLTDDPSPSGPLTALAIDQRAARLTLHGRWADAERLVDRGLAEARARGDRGGEARLILRRGRTLTERTRHSGGDPGPALGDLQAARRLADASGDRALLADTIDALGFHRFAHWFSSQDPADLAGSETLFREALALREPAGDSAGLSSSEFHVGLIHQMRGELPPAQQHFARSLAIAERVHDDACAAEATRHLGYLAQLRLDWPAAEQFYARSLELRERQGAGPVVAAAMVTLAELRYARDGDADRGLAMLGRARDTAAATGSIAYVSISGHAMARIHRDAGHSEAALRELAAAITAISSIHSDEDVPEMYDERALIELLRDRPAAAVAEIDRGLARRATPRLEALRALAASRVGPPAAPPPAAAPAAPDAVVSARRALAAGQVTAALEAALTGDDPDTLLLAARAAGGDRICTAARAPTLSRAQALRFERECRAQRAAALP
jgi:tetratricopeptide (TPR) repeat protein